MLSTYILACSVSVKFANFSNSAKFTHLNLHGLVEENVECVAGSVREELLRVSCQHSSPVFQLDSKICGIAHFFLLSVSNFVILKPPAQQGKRGRLNSKIRGFALH